MTTENNSKRSSKKIKAAVLKSNAKNCLAGKYQNVIFTFIFYVFICLVFARVSNSFTQQFCLSLMRLVPISEDSLIILFCTYFIPFVISIFENMIQAGVCLFFLNIACNHPYNAFDLLYGFSHQFGKFFCLSGVVTFFSFLGFLPMNFWLDHAQTGTLDQQTSIILLVSQIVAGLLSLYVSLTLSQVFFISLDHPELSAGETLKQSKKLMSGNKFRLFLLDISFLPLFLLAIPTLGLGYLWICPYMNMTHALFFLDLMQSDKA